MISDKYFCCPATKHRASSQSSGLIRFYASAVFGVKGGHVFLCNDFMYKLFIGSRLIIIRVWVGVEMAGVLGAQGVRELGGDLEGVGTREGVHGRVAWCGALSTEASYGGQS